MNESSKRLVVLFQAVGSADADPARLHALYERHGLEPKDGAAALVEEICLDGSNTFASVFRGWKGVEYGEIVLDVADKVKAEVADKDDELGAERAILDTLFQRFIRTADVEDRAAILEALRAAGVENGDLERMIRRGAWTAGTMGALVNSIGQRAVAEAVKRIVLITVGQQAALLAGKRALAIASYAIPLLNVVMVGWALVDLAGPAFRKTVPTVVDVALLRLEFGAPTESSTEPGSEGTE